MPSIITIICQSGVVQATPYIETTDAEHTMVEIINAMAARMPFVVVEDNYTSVLVVLGEVAGITLGAPPVAVQIERPKPRPVPLPQRAAHPEPGTLIAN
ncbi:hypothetical protein ACQR1Y_11665 [Bradyrhizobium sp. HKCCYLRH3099]|uniref:hypothetical protein n=1 Tax=unclassified Bradyrhizobium TaxID=2631580 RepID=UPI003EB7980E